MVDDEGEGRTGAARHVLDISSLKSWRFKPLAGPAVRNSYCLDSMAIPLPSLRTTRPFINNFKAHAPSSTQGQLTTSSIEPEKDCRSATSKSTPVLLMLQVLPDPQRSPLSNNLYSTASASGKRWRDRRSDEKVNLPKGSAATDIVPPKSSTKKM